MTDLEDIKDTLWMFSTHENHPWTVDEAHAAIGDSGELAVEALVWALQQNDIDLKLLALQLLQEPRGECNLYTDPVRVEELATGGGGHFDRLENDHLDDGGVWKHYRRVAVAQVPYFVWVSIATVLQLSITLSNW